jgi:hypothetical protein
MGDCLEEDQWEWGGEKERILRSEEDQSSLHLYI